MFEDAINYEKQLTRDESTKCGNYTLVRGEIKLSQSQDMEIRKWGGRTCELNLSQSQNRKLGQYRGRNTCELNLSQRQNRKLGHGWPVGVERHVN